MEPATWVRMAPIQTVTFSEMQMPLWRLLPLGFKSDAINFCAIRKIMKWLKNDFTTKITRFWTTRK